MPAFLSESVGFRSNDKWDEDYQIIHLGFGPPAFDCQGTLGFGSPCTYIQQESRVIKGIKETMHVTWLSLVTELQV